MLYHSSSCPFLLFPWENCWKQRRKYLPNYRITYFVSFLDRTTIFQRAMGDSHGRLFLITWFNLIIFWLTNMLYVQGRSQFNNFLNHFLEKTPRDILLPISRFVIPLDGEQSALDFMQFTWPTKFLFCFKYLLKLSASRLQQASNYSQAGCAHMRLTLRQNSYSS